MSDPFTNPATPSGGFTWGDVHGSLVLIDVISVEDGIQTVHGPSSAVRANVAVLDGDQAGETYDDTLVFPKVLQGQLKSRMGQKVLGRVTQGQAKPGQSAPWVLAEANPGDKAMAVSYLAKGFASPGKDDAPPF